MNSPDNNNIYRFMSDRPRLGERVYISHHAAVTGAVVLADDVSVWPMTVIRGDVNRIMIGARSNIQDGCVLHVTHEGPWQPDGLPLLVGEDVTVGHGAILHACTIGDRCLVGMGAIVMDGAVLEPDSMLARELTAEEISSQVYSAQHYVRLKDLYLQEQG